MGIFDDIRTELNNSGLQENSNADYLLAGVLLILYSLFLLIVRNGISKGLKRTEGYKTGDNERVKVFVDTFDKMVSGKFILLVTFYLAIRHLTIPIVSQALDFLILFAIAITIWRAGKKITDDVILSQAKKNPETKHIGAFFGLVAKFVLFIFISLWLLSALDVNITAYIAGLSVLGLAIAFSLQNVISDLFATITLYWDKPFQIGDTIQVAGETGTVEKIGLRSSHIRLTVGSVLIISNRELTTQRIINTKRMIERKVTIKLGIDMSTSVQKMEKMRTEVKEIVESFGNTSFNRFHLVNLGDFTYDFELLFTVKSPDFMQFMDTRHELLMQVLKLLEENQITLPFPTQTIEMNKN